jgi:two-component system, response regulator YesN
LRIVVVEDGVKIRHGMIHLIEKMNSNFQVVGEAANGLDGLKIISELKPDLVIADIRMPELSGLEMLQALKEQELKHKTIILSAYSDFSFAQQAISLGVAEYLLKPITAEKLQQSLIVIERELGEEHDRSQVSQLITEKNLFQDLMLGKTSRIKELRKMSNGGGEFGWTQPFVLVAAYTGGKIYDREGLQQVLKELLGEKRDLKYLLLDGEINGLTLIPISSRRGISEIESLLSSEMLAQVHAADFPDLVMGWIRVDLLEEVHTKLQQLSEMLKWALLLGKDKMVTQSEIAALSIATLVYPAELEKQAVSEVSRQHFQNLPEIFGNFLFWWTREKYYPEQIVASFVQFITSITNAVKETDLDLFKRLKQQEILQQTLSAITMCQLEGALAELQKRLCQTEDLKSNYSLPVVKALKIIVEQYPMGISREEIATRLHITPEYLSMLFYKEVGQSFTAYLKNYRIRKAKELLTNTDLKIYEIAEKVGYPDPKYFCRVFKEITGVPASEYQKYLLEHGG